MQQVYGSTREGTLVAAERREAAKAYFPGMAEKGHIKGDKFHNVCHVLAKE